MKSNYFIKALSYLKQSRSLLRTQVSSNDCYFNLKGFLRYDLLQIMFALSMDDSSSSSSLWQLTKLITKIYFFVNL